MYRIHRLLLAIIALGVVSIFPSSAFPQYANPTASPPLTSQELVRLVYELPKHPERHDEIVQTIRQRGIGFPLTEGLRSLVAAKSGSDAVLRRTLEEAERRRLNPKTEALPPEAEARDLLEGCRVTTLSAANAMPDFIVRQLIRRDRAYGNTANWIPLDNLTIGVSYRQNAGEQYRILTVNGMPLGREVKEGRDYGEYVEGGASSSGVEYISGLAAIFKDEARASFKLVDTDMIRQRRMLVYEYEVKREHSELELKSSNSASRSDSVSSVVGSRGRVWVDRENNRVLRFEQVATEIPGDFPIKAASSLIDFDWVTINEKPYLLPSRSQILISQLSGNQLVQSRNDIRFRGYQKFGAELKIIDEVDDAEVPPEKPEKPAPIKTKPPDRR